MDIEKWVDELVAKARASTPEPERPGSIPPAGDWPTSLSELAAEVAHHSGDVEGARREVWISWAAWKAADLNLIFKEQSLTGEPGRITAATVRHGEQNLIAGEAR